MYKKSVQIILIQIIGVILGVLSLTLVAGDMGPEVYSIIGVYNIVHTIGTVFSHLGIETVMVREALIWKEKGDDNKVCEYTTQSIISCIGAFLLLSPFLMAYLLYLNYTKYDNKYFILFLFFIFASMANALIDSVKTIIRSLGGYVIAQVINTFNSIFIKTVGIIAYLRYGATAYFYFNAVVPVVMALLLIVYIRKYIKLCYFNIKSILKKISDAKFLWMRSYLDYFKANADTLLVSSLFSPEVLGSYSVFKQIEQMLKNFIEGFFDTLNQDMVKYKGNPKMLLQKERGIKRVSKAFVLLGIIVLVICKLNAGFIINILNLNKYQDIELMLVFAALCAIVYIWGKYEINFLSFFATSNLNFVISIIVFAFTILSYGIVLIDNSVISILIQRLSIYFFYSALAIYLYKRDRNKMFANVLK